MLYAPIMDNHMEKKMDNELEIATNRPQHDIGNYLAL